MKLLVSQLGSNSTQPQAHHLLSLEAGQLFAFGEERAEACGCGKLRCVNLTGFSLLDQVVLEGHGT